MLINIMFQDYLLEKDSPEELITKMYDKLQEQQNKENIPLKITTYHTT